MKLLEQLHRWVQCFRRNGEDPAFIPLTAEELSVVVSDCRCSVPMVRFPVAPTPPEIFGVPVFDSPFAPEMRARQIALPVTQLEESAEVSMYREYASEDRVRDVMRRRLVAHICSDTTRLDLTFEWDVFAAFKRKFKLTRWFPVKTRTVRIDGRVLYPYLKIALPHNRHHATFRHVQ